MQIYDIIMLLVLLGAVGFGAWKGLAWQLASMAAIFLSYFTAYTFKDAVAPHLSAEPPWNVFLAMLILFLGTSLAVWVAFRFVKDLITRVKLKEFDRHTGALLGAVKGVALCLIITFFSMSLLGPEQQAAVCESYSGRYIAQLIDEVHVAMPEEIHEVLHPYLHTLDEKLHDHQGHDHRMAEEADGVPSAAGSPSPADPSSPDSESGFDIDRAAGRLWEDAADSYLRDRR